MSAATVRGLARSLIAMGIVGAMLVASACKIAPTAAPESLPAPPLRLIESKPLELAMDCRANGSFFVEFTVMSDGSAGHVRPAPAPVCVQQALMAWVSSFRYAPPGAETPSGIEWMIVTGRRGS